MISAIVAVDNNWGIGYNGDLLEHIPEDLKYFKTLTTGNTVVMGRKTWDSLPKKPLPNRHNLVITKDPSIYELTNEVWFYTLRQSEVLMLKNKNVNYFVMGGGQIYEKLLPLCDYVYVTKIYKDHDNVDTYFPNLDKLNNWEGQPISKIKVYNDIEFQFWKYKKTS